MLSVSSLLLFLIAGTTPTALGASMVTDDAFNWDSIKPSRRLEYHDCYKGGIFKCARLEVPLDWRNQSDPRTVAIAMRVLPAVVSANDSSFAGSVLTNPGGPGDSGVDIAGDAARVLQRVIDKPGRRHYEMVFFDPRGIGHTTPSSNCFLDPLSRDAWSLEYRGAGGFNGVGHGGLDFGSMAYTLAMNQGFARHCQAAEAKRGDAMAYVNTPSVARDMVEMIDRIDELRRQGTGAKPNKSLGGGAVNSTSDDGKLPRLQYIGFSYGTILGNYFASLFPGRVGRMVLDGVCDADDYANGPGWLTNTVDNDEIFNKFWQGCIKAGPIICPLASYAGDAQSRFWSWIKSLNESPRALVDPNANTIILTGDDVLKVVGGSFYTPIPGFLTIAASLSRAMSGNETELLTLALLSGGNPTIQDACPAGNSITSNTTAPEFPQLDPTEIEKASAILCGDGEDVTGKSVSWWLRYAQKQESISRVFGRYWTSTRLICSSWPFQANWIFRGPFTSPKPDKSLKPGVPAAPILFLSNRLDPVTPLRAARKMAANHPGSRVVVQEAIGHCTLVSAASNCTRTILADYLDSGVLPNTEISCSISCGPWDPNCDPVGLSSEGESRNDAAALFPLFNRNR